MYLCRQVLTYFKFHKMKHIKIYSPTYRLRCTYVGRYFKFHKMKHLQPYRYLPTQILQLLYSYLSTRLIAEQVSILSIRHYLLIELTWVICSQTIFVQKNGMMIGMICCFNYRKHGLFVYVLTGNILNNDSMSAGLVACVSAVIKLLIYRRPNMQSK